MCERGFVKLLSKSMIEAGFSLDETHVNNQSFTKFKAVALKSEHTTLEHVSKYRNEESVIIYNSICFGTCNCEENKKYFILKISTDQASTTHEDINIEKKHRILKSTTHLELIKSLQQVTLGNGNRVLEE